MVVGAVEYLAAATKNRILNLTEYQKASKNLVLLRCNKWCLHFSQLVEIRSRIEYYGLISKPVFGKSHK